MNFATMLAAEVKPLSAYAKERKDAAPKSVGGKVGKPSAHLKYAALCPATSSEIAAKLGVNIDTVATQMRRYEKRGWAERGCRVNTGTCGYAILWKWKGVPDAVESQ